MNSAAIFFVEKPAVTPCLDSEVERHSLSLGNRACSSNPEERALSAWCILLKTLGRNQTRSICWAGKKLPCPSRRPQRASYCPQNAICDLKMSSSFLLYFECTHRQSGASFFVAKKFSKMYLKIDRSVKTTPWHWTSMGDARLRMRAFKIHHFLISHNAPCPQIRCTAVYVKIINHIVHSDWTARKYYSDFNAMKRGLTQG